VVIARPRRREPVRPDALQVGGKRSGAAGADEKRF
jgi:hypothetical protein